MKGLSQRRRAQLGLYTVVILNVGVYIWSIIMQTKFNHHNPGHIDWEDGVYPSSFLPYFFVQTTGPFSQSYMYWLLSSFATDAQRKFDIYRDSPDVLKPHRKCPEWRCVQVHRSCWAGYCLRHEYPNDE